MTFRLKIWEVLLNQNPYLQLNNFVQKFPCFAYHCVIINMFLPLAAIPDISIVYKQPISRRIVWPSFHLKWWHSFFSQSIIICKMPSHWPIILKGFNRSFEIQTGWFKYSFVWLFLLRNIGTIMILVPWLASLLFIYLNQFPWVLTRRYIAHATLW